MPKITEQGDSNMQMGSDCRTQRHSEIGATRARGGQKSTRIGIKFM